MLTFDRPDLILPSVLLGFGAWIGFSDLKNGWVKNYMVLSLLLAALFVNVLVTRAFVDFPGESLANAFFGILAALIIWFAGLWSAADAKLFMALNVFLPVTLYQGAKNLFPGFSILTNLSLPLFFFFLWQALVRTNWREKKRAAINSFRPGQVGRVLLIVASFYSLVSVSLSLFHFQTEYFLRLVFLVIFFWFLEQRLKIKIEQFCAVFLVLALLFFPSLWSHQNLVFVTALSLAVLFSIWLLNLATPLYSRSVAIPDLKEGMILTESVVRVNDRYTKRPMSFITLMSLLGQRIRQAPVFGYNPDGLGPEAVKTIKSLYQQNQLAFDRINTSPALPFAPLIFLGAFLTYFCQGSLLSIF